MSLLRFPSYTKKLVLPFILILLIYVAFFHHLERASSGRYTFSIHSYGRELVVTSGPDHDNDTVMIRNNIIQIGNETYRYELNYPYDPNRGVLELYSNNNKIYTIVGFNSSFVSFHNADRVAHHGFSSNAPASVNHNDKQLIEAALTVHLRVGILYSELIRYIIIHAVLLGIGSWGYIKLTEVDTWNNKLRYMKHEKLFSFIGIMVMSIPIIYAMFIFFLLR